MNSDEQHDRNGSDGAPVVRLRMERRDALTPLLQCGVFVEATLPDSLSGVLGQLGFTPEYLEREVQTVFLDSRPVDDLDAALVRDGDVVGLAAAMPGLVGALLRRNSPLRGGRLDITDRGGADGGIGAARRGRIHLKLFNLVAISGGPGLLARGVTVSAGRLAAALADLPAGAVSVDLDGRPSDVAALMALAAAAPGDEVSLTVTRD